MRIEDNSLWAVPTQELVNENQVLLSVSDLYKSFGGIEALVNVSFEIKKNSITALIGPNGAGKTTLFNCISGLTHPDKGTITFRGEDITKLEANQVTKLGMGRTFQNIRLFQTMNVFENVAVGFYTKTESNVFDAFTVTSHDRKDRKFSYERGMELLDWVGIADSANRKPSEIPYADRRRLEIARALAMDPVLLMLDEPAAGMMRAEVNDLSLLVERVKSLGISVLLIEHNMNFVMNMSDDIFVLNFGRVIGSGTPQEIRGNQAVVEAYLGKGSETGK